jgi:hypothetical protein
MRVTGGSLADLDAPLATEPCGSDAIERIELDMGKA